MEYLAPYADVYRASGDSSLVDGLSGDWSYGDGRWQGFITRDRFHIVIDMLSDTQLHDISLNFMQFAGPEIFAPAKVEIACLSSDGTTTPLFQHEYDVSRATDYFIRNVEWRGNAVGRYVIVKASAGKYGGWIFTDEVFVNKK